MGRLLIYNKRKVNKLFHYKTTDLVLLIPGVCHDHIDYLPDRLTENIDAGLYAFIKIVKIVGNLVEKSLLILFILLPLKLTMNKKCGG